MQCLCNSCVIPNAMPNVICNVMCNVYLGDAGGPGADEADWRVGGLRDHRARLWWGYQEGAFIRVCLYMWYIRICLYMHTHTASPTVVRLWRKVHLYVYVCIYTHVCAFIRICVHLYVYGEAMKKVHVYVYV